MFYGEIPWVFQQNEGISKHWVKRAGLFNAVRCFIEGTAFPARKTPLLGVSSFLMIAYDRRWPLGWSWPTSFTWAARGVWKAPGWDVGLLCGGLRGHLGGCRSWWSVRPWVELFSMLSRVLQQEAPPWPVLGLVSCEIQPQTFSGVTYARWDFLFSSWKAVNEAVGGRGLPIQGVSLKTHSVLMGHFTISRTH